MTNQHGPRLVAVFDMRYYTCTDCEYHNAEYVRVTGTTSRIEEICTKARRQWVGNIQNETPLWCPLLPKEESR